MWMEVDGSKWVTTSCVPMSRMSSRRKEHEMMESSDLLVLLLWLFFVF